MKFFGPPTPVLERIQVFEPTTNEPTRDVLFKVKQAPPGCTCQSEDVAAKDVISSFGRPWTTSMLSFYSLLLVEDAVNPKHHLHEFCKNQLLEIVSFIRQYRLKMDEVFGKSMQLKDPLSKKRNQVIGPRLQALLGLSNKTLLSSNSQDSPEKEPSAVQSKRPASRHYLDFRTKDCLSKSKGKVPPENRPHLRKIQSILQRDDNMYQKVKKGGIKGLSLKSRGPKHTEDPLGQPQDHLGKRTDHPSEEEESWDTESVQQCLNLRKFA